MERTTTDALGEKSMKGPASANLIRRLAAEEMTACDFLGFGRAESGRFPGSKPVKGKTNKYWRLM
jgi:hypothetical protein